MKKIISIVFAAIMLLGSVACVKFSCTKPNEQTPESQITTNQPSNQPSIVPAEDPSDLQPEADPTEPVIVETEKPSYQTEAPVIATEEPAETETPVTTNPVVPAQTSDMYQGFTENDFKALGVTPIVSGNKANCAKFGQWAYGKVYNVISNKEETVAWRMIDITTDCQNEINTYNASHIYQLEPLSDEDLCYYMATYQVYFPENFPQRSWGISYPYMKFSTVSTSLEGDTVPIEYGDGKQISAWCVCVDLEVDREGVVAPGIYTGKCVYYMPKVEPAYLFEAIYSLNEEGTELAHVYCDNVR